MKKTVLLLLACIIFSSAFPVNTTGTRPSAAPQPAPSVFNPNLPFDMLDSVSRENVPLYPEFKQLPQKTNNDNGPHDKYCLMQDTGKGPKALYKNTPCGTKGAATTSLAVPESCASPPDEGRPAYHSLLDYLVLLHRSSLPWEAVKSFI